jgi:4-carboxymuconolactone decarboxylase
VHFLLQIAHDGTEEIMAPQTTETPVLDLLANMTADSVEASTLDPETLMLVRIAALVAVDAQPVSYLLNLAAARDVGLEPDQVRGVLAGIAPIVGTARVTSAMAKIVDALEIAIEVADENAQGGT